MRLLLLEKFKFLQRPCELNPNLLPLRAVLYGNMALCSQRSIQEPWGWSKFSPLGCTVRGFGPFPASSGGRWTGSCPEISAHLVGRSQPPVKRGQSSALSPIRTVYRATGASGWRRRWLHNLHTHISVQATAFTMTGIKNKPDPWAQSSVRILVNGVWRFRVKRFSWCPFECKECVWP